MDLQTICKKTGCFCVGASVWIAETAAKGAVAAGKGIAGGARAMTQKGEAIIVRKKAASAERRRAAEQAAPEEILEQPVSEIAAVCT